MISYISDPHHWTGIAESSRNAILYKLQDYRRTGLFSRAGVEVTDLLKPGMCSILMLRDLRYQDKSLITAIIARQLFTTMGEYHNRLKISKFSGRTNDAERLPNRVWLIIDEAHVVAPKDGVVPSAWCAYRICEAGQRRWSVTRVSHAATLGCG